MKMMENLPTRPTLRGLVLALAATVLSSCVATATPYATCLTNNAGTISFRLNEAADTVKVIWNGGASVTNLGARVKGLTVTNLGVVTSPFQVQVIKTGNNTIATNTPVAFNSVSAVAVNFNPKSPNFGRVFVGNTTNASKGQGVYVLQSDFTDVFGTNRTAGINFALGSPYSPWRLTVGEDDDQLYLTDYSNTNGNLYTTDQNLSTNSAQYALAQLGPCLDGTTNSATDAGNPPGITNNHGSIGAVVVFGTTNQGHLTIITDDEDLQDDRTRTAATQMNSVWRYDVGSGAFPFTNFVGDSSLLTNRLITPEIDFVSNVEGLAHGAGGTNGYLYFCQGRSAGNEPGVWVITNVFTAYQYAWNDPNVWNSRTASAALGQTTDLIKYAVAVTVSRDGRWLATINYGNNVVTIVRLTNGIPDLTRLVQYTGFGTTGYGHDIAFDAADNLYIASSGLGIVNSINLGLSATNTTGSDGTFTNGILPVVNVLATTNIAHRTDIAGNFTFYRDGDTSAPLKVFYTVTGTANNGVDYTLIASNITFAGGAASTNLTIAPLNSTAPVTTLSVIVTLTATPASYNLVEARSATVWIADNQTPYVTWARNYTSMYEREPLDFCRFTITRTGETNATITIPLGYSGTGVLGTDFTGPSSMTLNAGVISQVVEWFPLENGVVEGTLVPRVTMLGDSVNVPPTYTVGSSGTTFSIIDSDLAPETVLWSDNFSAYAGSGTNAAPPQWTFQFGSTNKVADYSFEFGHDYSAESLPLAPGASASYSLKATVNKFDTIATAAALNFYPTNQFSGNYALRFSMLQVNSTVNPPEHALFGINHSGIKTNWNRSGGFINTFATNQDGIWFSVSGSLNSGWDYCMWTAATGSSATSATILTNRTGNPATGMNQVFKDYSLANGPYGANGAPGCIYNGAKNWVDVEVANTTNLMTLKLNNQVILQQTNITPFQAGKVMLGYNDMTDSIGEYTNSAGGAAAYFANVRVISISAPTITAQPVNSFAVLGGTVTLRVAASTSTGTINYQWFKNGVVISGATGASLTIANFAAANVGSYYVIVGDGSFFSISQSVTLAVASAPKITPVLSGSTLNLTFPSQVGPTYYTEWKSALTDAAWNTLSIDSGTGGTITVSDGPLTDPARFYRVRLQ